MSESQTVYINNINEKVNINKLKKDLAEICTDFGSVLGVIANKGIKKRGQAFVVFSTREEAQKAIDALIGYEYHGKSLKAALARTKSDLSLSPEEAERAKQERDAKRPVPPSQPPRPAQKRASGAVSDQAAPKRQKIDLGEPHKILFIQNLPSSITPQMLTTIYSDEKGFVEARVFAARGVGFVEFAQEKDAVAAIAKPVRVLGTEAVVTYAKK